MKKLLIAILLIEMVSSCQEATVTTQSTKIVTTYGNEPLKLILIEGCEYLEYNSGQIYSLCHKGNCKNIIHLNKQFSEETLESNFNDDNIQE
jgi:hypothetical protein